MSLHACCPVAPLLTPSRSFKPLTFAAMRVL